MPRAIWSGAISFGLVNVPVRLFSATEQKDVSFHQFQAGTGERIRYKRVAEGSGEEVAYGDIVKGYELEKGRYVIVTPEELESVEPGRTRTIDLEDFIDIDEVDPISFETSYYVAPAEGAGAERSYALLRDAMATTGRVAIGRFVMRTKQYLAALRPMGDVLVLETMYFPDEVRDAADLDTVPRDVEVGERELAIATQLIDSLTVPWDPDRYQDTYRERILELIERKAEGEEVVVEPVAEPAPVVDLIAALEASLRERRGKGEASAPRGRPERGADEDLTEKSAEELRALAATRGIEGRSKMNRAQLVEALQEAS